MSEVFRIKEGSGGPELMDIPVLDRRFPVKTFFSSRKGGCSTGPYDSLNMGAASGDDPALVSKNRDLAFQETGCPVRCVSYPQQVHGDAIQQIRTQDLSLARVEPGSVFPVLRFPQTDAVITDVPGVLLTSLHADCIPVWLYDTEKHAAGLIHAGWRGTRADIAAKTLLAMEDAFGSVPEDVIAVIGPGISRCCFETGPEVYESFHAMLPEPSGQFSTPDGNGKYYLDLKLINRILLRRRGVEEIYVSGLCTSCRDDLFFSYRRDGGATGRMCAAICLQER